DRAPPHPDRRRRRGAPRHAGGADHARRGVPRRGGRERGRGGRQARRRRRALRRHPARHRPAGRRRPRVLRRAAPRRQADAGHHADRGGRGAGRGARARRRRQRLHRQALPPRRAPRPRPRPAPGVRQLRGRGVHRRPLRVPPRGQAAAGAGAQPQDPADGQGIQHPEVPLPGGRRAGAAPGAAARGVGLQQLRHHPHAGDPHLPPPPEDRARPVQDPPAADRERRLSLGRRARAGRGGLPGRTKTL
ncbi:MAG: Two-component transcriptional response regulator, LuxR family, partial [uncultured Acetobacteraceae bacterium]